MSLIIRGRWHSWHTPSYLSRLLNHLTSHLQLTQWLRESLGMDFFSSQTTQFMQMLISESCAVILSMCAQFPFVSVSNDTCCSVVTVQGQTVLLWFFNRSCLRGPPLLQSCTACLKSQQKTNNLLSFTIFKYYFSVIFLHKFSCISVLKGLWITWHHMWHITAV